MLLTQWSTLENLLVSPKCNLEIGMDGRAWQSWVCHSLIRDKRALLAA